MEEAAMAGAFVSMAAGAVNSAKGIFGGTPAVAKPVAPFQTQVQPQQNLSSLTGTAANVTKAASTLKGLFGKK